MALVGGEDDLDIDLDRDRDRRRRGARGRRGAPPGPDLDPDDAARRAGAAAAAKKAKMLKILKIGGAVTAGAVALYENWDELAETGSVDPTKQVSKAVDGLEQLFNPEGPLFSLQRLEGAADVVSGATGAVLGVGTQIGKAVNEMIPDDFSDSVIDGIVGLFGGETNADRAKKAKEMQEKLDKELAEKKAEREKGTTHETRLKTTGFLPPEEQARLKAEFEKDKAAAEARGAGMTETTMSGLTAAQAASLAAAGVGSTLPGSPPIAGMAPAAPGVPGAGLVAGTAAVSAIAATEAEKAKLAAEKTSQEQKLKANVSQVSLVPDLTKPFPVQLVDDKGNPILLAGAPGAAGVAAVGGAAAAETPQVVKVVTPPGAPGTPVTPVDRSGLGAGASAGAQQVASDIKRASRVVMRGAGALLEGIGGEQVASTVLGQDRAYTPESRYQGPAGQRTAVAAAQEQARSADASMPPSPPPVQPKVIAGGPSAPQAKATAPGQRVVAGSYTSTPEDSKYFKGDLSKLNGMDPVFVEKLKAASAEAGVALPLTSGFRTQEKQNQLRAAAVKKYGSEEAASKWVAKTSIHTTGNAADFSMGGDAQKFWDSNPKLVEAMEKQGLHRPLSHEAWHWESDITKGQDRKGLAAKLIEQRNSSLATGSQPKTPSTSETTQRATTGVAPTTAAGVPGAAATAGAIANAPKTGQKLTKITEGMSLADMLSVHESKGNYNIFNQGKAHGYKQGEQDFSKMSLNEVMAQQNLEKTDPKKLFAIGKYQIIPDTLKEAAKSMGLKGDEKFTPELQDKIFNDYLIQKKQSSIGNYIKTGKGLDKAAHASGAEWASVGVESKGGKSLYGGVNKAFVSPEQMKKTLTETRQKYQQAIAEGKTEKEAMRLATTSSSPSLAKTAQGAATGVAGMAAVAGIPGASAVAGELAGAQGSVSTSVEGLRLKSKEAISGGESHKGTNALAQKIQASEISGGVKRFTALNDSYHHSEGYKAAAMKDRGNSFSTHQVGLAADFTLNDPKQHAQAAKDVEAMLQQSGLKPGEYKVIDEYVKKTGGATGNHIHVNFKTKEAAEKYAAYASGQPIAKTEKNQEEKKKAEEEAKEAPAKDLAAETVETAAAVKEAEADAHAGHDHGAEQEPALTTNAAEVTAEKVKEPKSPTGLPHDRSGLGETSWTARAIATDAKRASKALVKGAGALLEEMGGEQVASTVLGQDRAYTPESRFGKHPGSTAPVTGGRRGAKGPIDVSRMTPSEARAALTAHGQVSAEPLASAAAPLATMSLREKTASIDASAEKMAENMTPGLGGGGSGGSVKNERGSHVMDSRDEAIEIRNTESTIAELAKMIIAFSFG